MSENDSGEWVAWRHREGGQYCYVPADVVLVSVNGTVSHLARREYSPLTPLRTIPVRFGPFADPEDYPGRQLLEEYEPA